MYLHSNTSNFLLRHNCLADSLISFVAHLTTGHFIVISLSSHSLFQRFSCFAFLLDHERNDTNVNLSFSHHPKLGIQGGVHLVMLCMSSSPHCHQLSGAESSANATCAKDFHPRQIRRGSTSRVLNTTCTLVLKLTPHK